MASIRTRGTTPELLMRKVLSSFGIRYRVCFNDLPGKPDIYVGRLRLAIFINGCFWHGHDCPRGRRPATNTDFWNAKIDKTIARDADVLIALSTLAIETLTIWSCQIEDFKIIGNGVASKYEETR